MYLRYIFGMHKMNNSQSDDSTDSAGADGAETQEPQELGLRHYKRLLSMNSAETYIPLTSYSERLLRQVPGSVVLYPSDDKNAAVTARALTSFAQRIKQSLARIDELNPENIPIEKRNLSELFGISTQQAVLLWQENSDDGPIDKTQRVIRCTVTHNVLYNAYAQLVIEENEKAAELALEGPKPQGRPRIHPEKPVKPKPPIDPSNPAKRGRGRPRKTPEGQDTLL